MPIVIPLLWIVGALSVALLGGGLYLFYEWYIGALVGTAILLSSVGMVALSLLGRPLALWLLARPGPQPLTEVPGGERHRLTAADGTELAAETFGSEQAPPLVLNHGWGLDRSVWYPIIPELAKRFRVIIWDLPGLGESSQPPDRDYHTERLATHLETVLTLAKGQAPIILGHSIGGMIIMSFARLFPERLANEVDRLVLVHTSPTTPTRTTFLKGFLHALRPLLRVILHLTIWLSPILWAMNWLSYMNGSLHLMTAWLGFAGQQTRGELDRMAYYTPKASPAVQARGALALFDFDETATLPTIQRPTLVVAASRDRITIPEANEAIHAGIPGSTLVTLQPAGHAGWLEQHEQFFQALDQFLPERIPANAGR